MNCGKPQQSVHIEMMLRLFLLLATVSGSAVGSCRFHTQDRPLQILQRNGTRRFAVFCTPSDDTAYFLDVCPSSQSLQFAFKNVAGTVD